MTEDVLPLERDWLIQSTLSSASALGVESSLSISTRSLASANVSKGHRMPEPGSLAIDLAGIAHLLRDKSLEVPPFQRNYSWTEDQVDEFWFDLKAALTMNQSLYFLGTLVLGRTASGAASVIDGQQRLATTSMLLAAARDLFRERGDSQRADGINNRYLSAFSLTANKVIPKLILNTADREFFSTAILGLDEHADQAMATEISRPNGDRALLSAAFKRLRHLLSQELDGAGPTWTSHLLRWIQFLDEQAQVIVVNVTDDSEAFIIFETLNDRGIELSVADLIKNYLLGLSGDDLVSAQNYWLSANQAVEEVADTLEVTRFVRQWWSSIRGATRERDLYSSLRREIRSQTQANNTLRALADSAVSYAALLDPSHEYWADHRSAAPRAIAILNDLGLEQYRPLALAAMAKFEKSEIDDLVETILNWSVRGLVAGGIGGGVAERAYAEAGVRVNNGRAESTQALLPELDRVRVSDRQFEAAFATRSVLRSSYLRYYLNALSQGTAIPSTKTLLTPVAYFPRFDRHDQWDSVISPEDRRQICSRIGNFGLFDPTVAKQLSTEPLQRLEEFKAYDALDRLGLGWQEASQANVDRRQTDLSVLAVDTWPLLAAEIRVTS